MIDSSAGIRIHVGPEGIVKEDENQYANNWRWANQSRNCRRDRIIKVSALLGSGAISVGSFVWSCVNLGNLINTINSLPKDQDFDERLHASGNTLSFAGSIVGLIFSTAQSALTVGLALKKLDLTDYSNPDIAEGIAADLLNKSLSYIEITYGWRTSSLTKYGFIRPEHKPKFDELVNNYYQRRKDHERYMRSLETKHMRPQYSRDDLATPLNSESHYPLGEDPLQILEAEWRTFVEESIIPNLPDFKITIALV